MSVQTIGRRDLILLLVGVDASGHVGDAIGGLTRLQKLLFLLEREEHVSTSGEGFVFEPYKAGPYSSRLYDDLEFLENLGLLKREVSGRATEIEIAEENEIAELDRLTFGDLMGDGGEDREGESFDSARAADAYEEHRYSLTEMGCAKVKAILEGKDTQLVSSIRRIKSKYAAYSLTDLLHYVYTKYPDMTTESEIKEKVLRSRQTQ